MEGDGLSVCRFSPVVVTKDAPLLGGEGAGLVEMMELAQPMAAEESDVGRQGAHAEPRAL